MMDLTPRRLNEELDRINQDMESLWNRLLGKRRVEPLASEWMPAVDLSETDDALHLLVELPGVNADDVTIHVFDDLVTLRGEKKWEDQEAVKAVHTQESHFGPFQRAIQLPAAVDRDQVEVSYRDGILKIKLQKAEPFQKKRIEIKTH